MSSQANKGGFTLIEVLIASGILALSVGSVLRMGQVAVRSQDVATERVQANQLITEVTEIAHQIRETNLQDGDSRTSWSFNLPSGNVKPFWSNNKWMFVYAPEEKINLSNSSGTSIEFTRKVVISKPPTGRFADMSGADNNNILNNNLLQIKIDISWETHGQLWSSSVTTLIGNRRGI